MFAEERQLLIAVRVNEVGRVTVNELAERFSITPETVRRDLDALESARQLRRVHGGAVAMDRLSTSEPSITERQTQHQPEKARIAQAALKLIPTSPNASIILDAGTTTERLAERLVEWTPARPGDQFLVITNGLPIALKLAGNDDIQVHILGGRVRGLTSAIVGSSTTGQLEAFRTDVAFVGTNGLDAEFGLSTPDSVEAAVKTAMIRSARRVVALVDSSKLGEESLVRFAGLADIDTLVTEAHPSAQLAAALAAADVEIVIA